MNCETYCIVLDVKNEGKKKTVKCSQSLFNIGARWKIANYANVWFALDVICIRNLPLINELNRYSVKINAIALIFYFCVSCYTISFQYFDTVGWVTGRGLACKKSCTMFFLNVILWRPMEDLA